MESKLAYDIVREYAYLPVEKPNETWRSLRNTKNQNKAESVNLVVTVVHVVCQHSERWCSRSHQSKNHICQ